MEPTLLDFQLCFQINRNDLRPAVFSSSSLEVSRFRRGPVHKPESTATQEGTKCSQAIAWITAEGIVQYILRRGLYLFQGVGELA